MTPGLDATLAMAWRTWRTTLRRPVLFAFSLGQPLIWMLFFGFLFQRFEVAGEGVAYLDFLAAGVSVMTLLFGATQSGTGWLRDLATGFLLRLLRAPASPWTILAGKTLADTLRLLAQAAVILAAAVLLGARPRPSPAPLAAAVLGLALFAAAFCCLSSAFALRTRAQEAMAAFIHLVNMPLLFTSTALVPRGRMPGWLATVSDWNPLSLVVEGWRGALLGGSGPDLIGNLLPLAALLAIFFPLALIQLRAAGRGE